MKKKTGEKSRALDSYERVPVETRAELRRWLEKNHARAPGAWVVTFKKTSGKPRVEPAEVAEEAICFGWVDSLPRKLDAERSMLLVTPRQPKSAWSKLNKDRAEKLVRAGLVTPSGLAAIELAKRTGRWSALDAVETLAIPPDLEASFAKSAKARAYFEAFPRSVQRAILEWISTAKKPETRRKRVEETARLAAKNIRANQWRP